MLVDKIIAYESGELAKHEFQGLFAELIATGLCWSLQGHYGRTAKSLLDSGYISKEGKILKQV